MCVDIHAFEKALAQIQERVKAEWTMYKWYLLHKKDVLCQSKGKKLSIKKNAVLIENNYNPPHRSENEKTHADLRQLPEKQHVHCC